ncbi:hypothetical protein D7X33_45275 [Butyricicoccus sp. 1XD8-22]|nr:hypothetical protein D7X33_45275 [Butyricicoccus sp. 1XD8-22]
MDLTGKNVICYVRTYGYQKLYKELSELIVYCSTYGGKLHDPCLFYDLDSESDDLRPGLDAVIQLVKNEDIDVVLVFSYHRIHLDYQKFNKIKEIFDENNVLIHSIGVEVIEKEGLFNDLRGKDKL